MQPLIYVVPLTENRNLLYAPLHKLSALVNDAVIRNWFIPSDDYEMLELQELLSREPYASPQPRRGELTRPPFLGIVPTRGCNMSCAYCDFSSGKRTEVISLPLIRSAIDSYSHILGEDPLITPSIHFFGGEPMAAASAVCYAVEYARERFGKAVHLEMTTNGYYPKETAEWAAENFDTIVLSFDGSADIQNLHRPAPNGEDSYNTVAQSAGIFSHGKCELIIRSCISAESAPRMKAWAELIAETYQPAAICFEPMSESPLSLRSGLEPPEANAFIRGWREAFRVLRMEGIQLIFSGADLTALQHSICPLGKDALIVTPNGKVRSCWQISEDSRCEPFDLTLGSVDAEGAHIDPSAVQRVRDLSQKNRSECAGCFAYYHCAGGCLLNHNRASGKDPYFCRLSRTLVLWQLLENLGAGLLADRLCASSAFVDELMKQDSFLFEEKE